MQFCCYNTLPGFSEMVFSICWFLLWWLLHTLKENLCLNISVFLNCQNTLFLQQNTLKLGDFGSCRSIYSKQPYTEYISTRWYRAPECLLTDGYYSYKIDMWSAGCVFYEITRYSVQFLIVNPENQR